MHDGGCRGAGRRAAPAACHHHHLASWPTSSLPHFCYTLHHCCVGHGQQGPCSHPKSAAHLLPAECSSPGWAMFRVSSTSAAGLPGYAEGCFHWDFNTGAAEPAKLLVFTDNEHGLMLGVHQARTRLSGSPCAGRTQFRLAITRSHDSHHSPEVPATPNQLQALRVHAGYPSNTSKGNLAPLLTIRGALAGLNSLPTPLDVSFRQLLHLYNTSQLPPLLVETPAPAAPPPPPPAQAPQPYFTRVSACCGGCQWLAGCCLCICPAQLPACACVACMAGCLPGNISMPAAPFAKIMCSLPACRKIPSLSPSLPMACQTSNSMPRGMASVP